MQQWLDSTGGIPDNRSLSPPNNSDLSSSGGSPPMSHMHAPPMTPGTPAGDDEIIPTAIVIKNIPFNVKRETLLDIIVSMSWFFPRSQRVSTAPHRHRSPSRRLTHSTITLTSRASSVALRSLISVRPQTLTPLLLRLMVLTCKVASSESSTRRCYKLGRRSASNARRPSGACAPCSWKRNNRRCSTSSNRDTMSSGLSSQLRSLRSDLSRLQTCIRVRNTRHRRCLRCRHPSLSTSPRSLRRRCPRCLPVLG